MRVLLFLSLLLAAASTAAKDGAVVVVPRLLSAARSPWTLAAFGRSAGAPLTLRLRNVATGQVVASGSATADTDGFTTVELALSEAGGAGAHSLESSSERWSSSANVTLFAPAPFLHVLLDKRLYKPGEKVRVRVLALSTALLPLPGTALNLSVLDPSGFVVGAEKGVKADEFGVHSFVFAVASEPPLGGWKVVAQGPPEFGAAAEAPFSLERYVLPTFAVHVAPKSSFLVKPRRGEQTVQLEGTLTARRTNGEALGGAQVTLSVTQPQPMWGRRRLQHKIAAAGVAQAAFAADMPVFWGGGGAIEGGGQPQPPLATQKLTLQPSASGQLTFSLALPVSRVSWGGDQGGGSTPALVLTASVEESATGEVQNGSTTVAATAHALQVSLDAPSSIKPGLSWWVTARVSAADGGPPPADDLLSSGAQLAVTATANNGVQLLNLALPLSLGADGTAIANITMPPDGDVECCNRSALGFVSSRRTAASSLVAHAYANVADASSGSSHFLSLGRLSWSRASSLLRFTPSATLDGATVSWAALRPGSGSGLLGAGVVKTGQEVSARLGGAAAVGAGDVYVLAWLRDGGSLIFDSAALPTSDPAPPNASAIEAAASKMLPGTPLRAAFDSESVKPGTPIVVSTTGAPSCRVFFAATDASVALLAGSGGDAALNASGILTAAGAAEAAALDSTGGGSGGVGGSGCWSAPEWWRAGAVLATSLAQGSCQDGGGGGIMQAAHFKGGGAEMAMNARAVAMPFAANAVMDDGSGGGGGGGGAEPPRERTSFPETWIWTSADADAKGAAALGGLFAPDTLTAWQLSAFSLHPVDGIQVAPPPTPLTVHQPLSLRLALPPSAVRGERLTLRAALYSALPVQTACTVKLQLDDASGLVLAAGQSAEARLILPPAADKNSPTSAGVSFQVTPTQLGPITVRLLATSDGPEGDALSSQLLVVPEGLPEEVTSNGVLNASAASPAARTLTLSAPVPASAVPGSARSTLSVTGDIMGPSLQGLGRLLVVPTGCGEQTMIGVAPNVAVLQYSAALPTPLSAQLVESAKANAALGWQRELTYRHPDGSFSAFGTTDVSGSTWLTAFVLRVFSASMPFIQIDASALAAASSWLAGQQNTDGSFRSVGNVIHTDMVGGGGAAANFSLTAFVLAALLEAPPGIAPPSAVVHAAVRFLLPPPPEGAYARHVRAHSLALACCRGIEGACEATDAALTDLMSRLAPDEEGGLPHWRVGEATAPANGCWQAPPADIELTGYGVLALLARGRAADAAGPARWLVSQRNGGGGFGSTQDTVVGLAALSGFAAATSGSPPALMLSVSLASDKGTPWKTVHVDASNSGVLQQFEAPPGAELIVTGEGVGAALLQLTSRFSVLPAPTVVVDDAASAPAFLLSTEALNVTTAHRRRRSLLEAQAGASTTVLHHRTCFARAAGSDAAGGSAADEGMVLLSVGLFSGYTPVASSLAAAQASAPHLVKRVEAAEDGRGVSFYLDKLSPSDVGFCLSFDAQQTADVAQLAPASASLHSYYSPQQRAATSLAASDVRPAAERPPSGVAPASPSAFMTRVKAPPIRPSGGAWSRWAVKGTLLAGASVALLCVWWPSGVGKLARAALRRLQRKD